MGGSGDVGPPAPVVAGVSGGAVPGGGVWGGPGGEGGGGAGAGHRIGIRHDDASALAPGMAASVATASAHSSARRRRDTPMSANHRRAPCVA